MKKLDRYVIIENGDPMSVAIVANPCAGRGKGQKTANKIERLLQSKNIDFQMYYTQYPCHAIELAQRAAEQYPVVAALGGDGTITEVLEGIWQSQAHLGIIPSGTGNDYARGLNIPLEPVKAMDIVLQGHTTKIDVGVERDKVFGVLASIGFPVTVIEYVNQCRDSSWLRGPLAILTGVIQTIRNLESHQVQLTIDGQEFDIKTVGILVMNMPYGGGGLKFAPDAKYDDGLLTIVVVEDVGRLDLMKTLPLVYSGKHTNHPKVKIYQGKSIGIEIEGSLPKMFDGEIRWATPLTIDIMPNATSVIVPTPKI